MFRTATMAAQAAFGSASHHPVRSRKAGMAAVNQPSMAATAPVQAVRPSRSLPSSWKNSHHRYAHSSQMTAKA